MQIVRQLPVIAWACLAAAVGWVAYVAVAVYASATGGPFLPTTVHVVVFGALTALVLALMGVGLIQWLDRREQRRAEDRDRQFGNLSARLPTATMPEYTSGQPGQVYGPRPRNDVMTFDFGELRGFVAGSMATDDPPVEPDGTTE